MKFTELNIDADLLKGIDEAGYEECLPVQEQTFAHSLLGKDVAVQSQTGSGKTAVFLVTIFHLLRNDPVVRGMKALVVAPTRELAVQIEKEAKLLGKYVDLAIGCFYGGVGYVPQEKILRDGVDVIIGTPGRLLDYNESGKIDFGQVGIMVIDEADRLFDMGFFPDLKRMLRKMPPVTKRRTMLFSATLAYRVRDLASQYMNDPVEVMLTPDQMTVDTISQKLYHVAKEDKMRLLLGILQKERPNNAIIFTNMKIEAMRVARRLEANGYDCEYIMGDLPQSKRLKVIEGVKSGKIKYLVATDVAARGLHIDDLELVVNYDLPEDSESYVHRIGRTARVGKEGRAISLVCEKYVYGLEGIESLIRQKIPVEWAEDDLYAEDKSAGMHFHAERDRDGRGRRKERPDGRRREKPSRERPRPERHERPARAAGAVRPERHERPLRPETREVPADTKINKKRTRRDGSVQHDGTRVAARAPGAPAHGTPSKPHPAPSGAHRKKEASKESRPGRPSQKPGRKTRTEDRLEYYRSKYGDKFVLTPEQEAEEKRLRKQGLLGKVLGLFRKKK